jgi:hypothetical protein
MSTTRERWLPFRMMDRTPTTLLSIFALSIMHPSQMIDWSILDPMIFAAGRKRAFVNIGFFSS